MQDLESEIRRPLKRVCETAGSSTFQTPAFYCVRQFTAYLFHQQDGLMEYCGVWSIFVVCCAHCCTHGFRRTAK